MLVSGDAQCKKCKKKQPEVTLYTNEKGDVYCIDCLNEEKRRLLEYRDHDPLNDDTTEEHMGKKFEEQKETKESEITLSNKSFKVIPFTLSNFDFPVTRLKCKGDSNHYFLTPETDIDAFFQRLCEVWYKNVVKVLPQLPQELFVFIRNHNEVKVWSVSNSADKLKTIAYPLHDVPESFKQFDITSIYPQEKQEEHKPKKKKKKATAIQTTLESFVSMLIPVRKLKVTNYQFRDGIDQEHVRLLASSMLQKRKDGTYVRNIEPVIVRELKDEPGYYEILSGHHRVEAAKAAGLQDVKCEVMNVDDVTAIEVAIISNFTKKKMTILEEARALKAYQEITNYTQSQIAEKLGKSQQWVSARLALLTLPKEVQQALETSAVSISHIKPIQSLPEEDQVKIIRKAAGENLSVREIEEIVQEKKKKKEEKEKLQRDLEKFRQFLNDNPELKDKRISSTEVWSDDKEEYYDIYIRDLLENANLHEYAYVISERKPFVDLLKTEGYTVVNGEALRKKAIDEKRQAEERKKQEEKMKDPCKYCCVPIEILGKRYCPHTDFSAPKPNCEHFVEDDDWGCHKKFDDATLNTCYICQKPLENSRVRILESNRKVHAECYYDLLKLTPSMNIVYCKSCRKKGNCKFQGRLYQLAKHCNHDVVFSIENCSKFKDESELEQYFLQVEGSWFNILDEFHDEIFYDRSLVELAKKAVERNITPEQVVAEDAESEAQLGDFRLLLKQTENKLLYLDEAFKYVLCFDEFDSLAELAEYVKEHNIDIETIVAANDVSREKLEKLKQYIAEEEIDEEE